VQTERQRNRVFMAMEVITLLDKSIDDLKNE